MDATKREESSPRRAGGWRTLLVRSIILVVVIGLAGVFLIRQNNQAIKRKNQEDTALQVLKQPQKIALDAVAADNAAKEALGDDIKDAGGLSRDGVGELGNSDVIHFDVAGAKQKGRVTASATFQKGAWQVTEEIQVKLADGNTLKVAKPGEKPPDINLDL